MWTWLRILLPELDGTGSPALGDGGGLNWYQVMDHQRMAVLRKGGLMNLAATLSFAVLWVLLAIWLMVTGKQAWLLLPASLSLLFALGLFRRYRLIVDTPTSRLSSGAQGYVELKGVAALPVGEASRGLPHLPPTVWLPGYIEDAPFILDDGHGQCLLYPRHAEIVTRPGKTHFSWLSAIYPGQTLYVLGELQTLRQTDRQLSQRERISSILAEWKRNPAQLLRSFDANGNGCIEPDEWEKAREVAAQWAAEDEHEQQRMPGTHVMDDASAGQLFLITNILPEDLAYQYRLAAWFHVVYWLGLLALA